MFTVSDLNSMAPKLFESAFMSLNAWVGSKFSGSGSIIKKKLKLDPTPVSPEFRTGVTRTTSY
jgi:hypothetical protein